MKRVIATLALLALTGCTKLPESLESPGMTLQSVIENNKVNFIMKITAVIKNDNNSIAFFDYRGELVFKIGKEFSGKSNVAILPFVVRELLPFQFAVVNLEAKGSDEDFKPICDLLEIKQEELIKSGEIYETDIPDDSIELRTISYRKENIYTLLKGKPNEKN